MILFQMIIQIAVGTVSHSIPELGPYRSGIGVVPVSGNAVRHYLRDGPGGLKECLGGGAVACFTEKDINQAPVPIYRAIEIGPATLHL